MYRKRIVTIIVLMGLGIGVYFMLHFYQIFFWKNTRFENEVSYVFIDTDDTLDSLSIQLEPLLKSVRNFQVAANKKGYTPRPGKYKIPKGLGNNEIINILRSRRLTVSVTFNNQERLENLAGRLSTQIAADSLSLLQAFRDPDFLQKNGFAQETALAMYLPNTYDCFWDISPVAFRERMLIAYKTFWTDARKAAAQALGLTPEEVITLASIVQKESVKATERPRIAGVYLNRLRKKIKLQADPTVIYAIKLERNDFEGVIKRVLYKDLKLESPYNTYQAKGLPPGPITMPDLSSIKAVLNPEKHSYLYFVANPDQPGYHLFAKTLIGHNRNKKRYTDWLNQIKVYR